MMVSITNGLQTVVVSSGAYREIYLPQGWQLAPEKAEALPQVQKQISFEDLEVIPPVAPKDDQEDLEEPQEEDNEDQPEEGTEADILLRPLGELSLDELKTVALLKGIATEGLRTRKEIRQAIRSAEV